MTLADWLADWRTRDGETAPDSPLPYFAHVPQVAGDPKVSRGLRQVADADQGGRSRGVVRGATRSSRRKHPVVEDHVGVPCPFDPVML